MVIEYARNVAGLDRRQLPGVRSRVPHLVIDLMDEQREVVDMGGTMRLGPVPGQAGAPARVVAEAYGRSWSTSATATATRSTPGTEPASKSAGLVCSGTLARRSPGGVHRAARPPVLGRDPGPSRVQEPPRRPPPPVQGPGRRRARPGGGPLPAGCIDVDALPGLPQARRGGALFARLADPGGVGGRSRAPTANASSATWSTIPGRWSSCPLTADGHVLHGPPVPGRGRRASSWRCPPASATSRASRPR